ncbi:MAG: hypothetical protein OIN86_14520 [Candidatus Methanoperedens sp.]|nr:hypothetical protein [Candidatus Methanoperedens sp.]CAG1001159.1 hypothetical protein METP1_02899 [Methanosarcinales archaeon]
MEGFFNKENITGLSEAEVEKKKLKKMDIMRYHPRKNRAFLAY